MPGFVTRICRWCDPAFFQESYKVSVKSLDIDLQVHRLARIHDQGVLLDLYVVLRIFKHIHFKGEVTNTVTYIGVNYQFNLGFARLFISRVGISKKVTRMATS